MSGCGSADETDDPGVSALAFFSSVEPGGLSLPWLGVGPAVPIFSENGSWTQRVARKRKAVRWSGKEESKWHAPSSLRRQCCARQTTNCASSFRDMARGRSALCRFVFRGRSGREKGEEKAGGATGWPRGAEGRSAAGVVTYLRRTGQPAQCHGEDPSHCSCRERRQTLWRNLPTQSAP